MSVRPGKRRRAPAGWEIIEPTLTALEEALRDANNAPTDGKPKSEVLWPIYQINNQRSRYIYDMHYKYHKISRDLYDYCVNENLADAALIAKWKKPGYRQLCSTQAIQSSNFAFGGVCLCRVPKRELDPGKFVRSPLNGCLGCADDAPPNIFGNKFGQRLADIQMERERRQEAAALADETAQNAENDTKSEPRAAVEGGGGGGAAAAAGAGGPWSAEQDAPLAQAGGKKARTGRPSEDADTDDEGGTSGDSVDEDADTDRE